MADNKKKASFSFYRLSVIKQYGNSINQQNLFPSKLKNIQDIFLKDIINYPNYVKISGVCEFTLYLNYKIDANIICGTIGILKEGEQKHDINTKQTSDLKLKANERLITPSSFLFDLHNNILMYETNQQGVSYSDFIFYISRELFKIDQRILSENILITDEATRLSKLVKISGFEMKIAKKGVFGEVDDPFGVGDALKDANYDSLYINMKADVKKNNVGLGNKIKETANYFSNIMVNNKTKGDILIVSGIDEYLDLIRINLTDKLLKLI